MTGLEHARQVLGDEIFLLAQETGQDAPELTDEQIARLRVVLAQPAAQTPAA